ncbi:MAG TPA: hypothetical protein VEI01_23330 [Terriglobales bacterium]|nr:hypothetical protein [Terriglobales bacterium]
MAADAVRRISQTEKRTLAGAWAGVEDPPTKEGAGISIALNQNELTTVTKVMSPKEKLAQPLHHAG